MLKKIVTNNTHKALQLARGVSEGLAEAIYMEKKILDGQNLHWEATFSSIPEMFGEEPSEPAVKAAALFSATGARNILELGSGQGRDAVFFARNGFMVNALDYSQTGLAAMREKAVALGVSDRIKTLRHDVRQPLPFEDNALDACFSHMLFCMALTEAELVFLSSEIRRVLKPGGICVYTARHTGDPHYRDGEHLGENLYENGGFIVHFFNEFLVRKLVRGHVILDIAEFEEGVLPRKLFQVSMKKA